jgi:hypothetical protein
MNWRVVVVLVKRGDGGEGLAQWGPCQALREVFAPEDAGVPVGQLPAEVDAAVEAHRMLREMAKPGPVGTVPASRPVPCVLPLTRRDPARM